MYTRMLHVINSNTMKEGEKEKKKFNMEIEKT